MILKALRKITSQIKRKILFQRIYRNLYITCLLDVEQTDQFMKNEETNLQKNKTKIIESGPIFEYLKSISSNSLVERLPQGFLRRKHIKPNTLYLVNRHTAKEFALLIAHDLLLNASYIAEANPGFGLLTKELLASGVPTIHLFEPSPNFTKTSSLLTSLIKVHPKRLKLKHKNILQLWKIDYNEDFKKDIFEEIQPRGWEDKPYIQIVGIVGNNTGFMDTMIKSFINRTNFMNYGRPKMYLAVHPSTWARLTSTNKNICLYKWKAILFQLLFDYNHVGTLDRKSFLPWGTKATSTHKNKIYKELDYLDNEYMYVVQIEPKLDIFKHHLKEEDLLPLWFFVKNNTTCRKTRVIPELEKWVPGCGLRLIALNVNIFTQFGDLSPNEILAVFKAFISCPGYERSTFLTLMESNFVKDIETEEQDTIHETQET